MKWDAAQPGAKLAAMSNKNKSQQQQQQPQQQQLQQHPAAHVIKPVDQVPPRYQPPPQPPQPTVGILKNHPQFPSTVAQTNGVPAVGINLPQGQQPRQLQPKDAPGKFPSKIDHSQPATLPTSLATTLTNPKTSHGYLPGKLPSQGPFLPPTSQYPPTSQTVVRPRITDEEFLRLGPVEMLKFVRKTESDFARVAAEQNRQIQSLLSELRALKEANQRLSDDNQELRDLCCFLDDDRQKGRKLAREWQRFGRYTASVMRQEVSAYQNKLRQLDNKQQELIKDNLELKELCLYLDEERGGGQRDDGDGSSSSTNAEETAPPRTRHASTFNDQTMQYVRSLEQRVKQLEEDKSILQARTQGWEPPPGEVWENPSSPNGNPHITSRPEAVVRALQVLEVREQLEREAGHDGEKALVREMCNVVWRKLEEGGPQTRY
ncbi:coiled-coil domain-containing protein 85C [Orussus abietinus]|uniref:coiled-coil domain-containing protein 85C n=1 Tax=Orussus abietinus TaxID=222816 RepID=UPI000625D65B|nr:coiled-coil domain-containing protein 85C [Orussus abietinus]XP_012283777.1 coiled-coil domain-containing protein 85C [Orussus abietinus]XP_012283778.1 coiled-coil domain-containing protein 85C [Orussus abietinus]XP_023287961.1 coiled-coil domain-containing protein 85C [Orussus abietinus]